MQKAVDSQLVPKCGGCGGQSVGPSVHTYKGAYFCIRCCNYLDDSGAVKV